VADQVNQALSNTPPARRAAFAAGALLHPHLDLTRRGIARELRIPATGRKDF
jgi:hypothetical protein